MRTVLRYGMMPLAKFLDRFTRDPASSCDPLDPGRRPWNGAIARTRRAARGTAELLFRRRVLSAWWRSRDSDALIKQLKGRGGEIHVRSDVSRILVRGGRAVGVRLADGREATADIVVSNADPGLTWGRLVDPEHVSPRLRRRVRHLRYSISTLSLFMAVDMDLRAAGLDSGNVWYGSTPDIDASYELAERADLSHIDEIPGLFFNVTTLKDPTLRADSIHTVEALALASPDAFARWRDTNPAERPEDYEALKAYLSEKILDSVERFVPGLRDRVVFSALGTPLTNIHYLHATRGGMYGTENTIKNLGPFSFPVRSRVPGLFQCGASTISPGIHGVTRSGLAAAAARARCEQTDELLTERSGPLRVYSAEDSSSWPD